MRFNKENTMNREMNNSRTKKYDLPGIYGPGTHEDCRKQALGHTMQSQVQQTEQTAITGYFRTQIPEHDPIKGDAG